MEHWGGGGEETQGFGPASDTWCTVGTESVIDPPSGALEYWILYIHALASQFSNQGWINLPMDVDDVRNTAADVIKVLVLDRRIKFCESQYRVTAIHGFQGSATAKQLFS